MDMLLRLIRPSVAIFLIVLGLATPAYGGIPVPEIDPGSGAGALALLAGAVLMITGRRGRK
jgi:hypothetical protein